MHFKLKETSFGPPDIYLGGKLRKITITTTEGEVIAWYFISSQYVKDAVSNVESYLREKKGMKFPKLRDAPISSNYRPEIDESK